MRIYSQKLIFKWKIILFDIYVSKAKNALWGYFQQAKIHTEFSALIEVVNIKLSSCLQQISHSMSGVPGD
jgi:hypothetical protein